MFEIQNIIFINISMLEDKIDISSIDKLYILMKIGLRQTKAMASRLTKLSPSLMDGEKKAHAER
jgi:hypothetical protein